jgi:hypothetical protein
MPAKMAPTIPASTPGIPCRLCTPHVSCSFRLLSRKGCQHRTKTEQATASVLLS